MVKLLECEEHPGEEEFTVRVDQLQSLEKVSILSNPDANRAIRKLSKEHVERLMFSDPTQWPPIIVTWTDQGYVIVDGYHRVKAMEYKGVKEIRAICRVFESEIEVIRAAYGANREHGLPIPAESRSAYAYWLHTVLPSLTQEQIGLEAGISQPTVSVAISRREEKKKKTAKKSEPTPLITPQPEPPPEEVKRESAKKDWQAITRDVKKLLDDTKDLEEGLRRAALMDALGNIQDRDSLLELARFIQEILAPPPPPPTRIPRKRGQT
jgi:ParB-like chromosome segregation protein Spo0J